MTPSSTHPEAGTYRTAFYDARGENRFVKGKGARTDERPYRRPPGSHTPNARYALNWGMQVSTVPIVEVDRDLGAFVRVFHSRQYFGYRRAPFASRHSFSLGLATSGLKPLVSYTGTFRRLLRDVDATVHVEYSGIETIRFTGFGNDTEVRSSSSFYKWNTVISFSRPPSSFDRNSLLEMWGVRNRSARK